MNFEYEVRKEKGEDAQEEDDAPDSIIPLLALHTTAQIVKCMKNSFAKRCIKADFVSLVDRMLNKKNAALSTQKEDLRAQADALRRQNVKQSLDLLNVVGGGGRAIVQGLCANQSSTQCSI